MTSEPDRTLPGSSNAPEGTGGSAEPSNGTWRSTLVAQVLISLVAVGYGMITKDWLFTGEIIGGCLIFGLVSIVFLWIRAAVRRRRPNPSGPAGT